MTKFQAWRWLFSKMFGICTPCGRLAVNLLSSPEEEELTVVIRIRRSIGYKAWRCWGLNPGHHTCKAWALPPSYIPTKTLFLISQIIVLLYVRKQGIVLPDTQFNLCKSMRLKHQTQLVQVHPKIEGCWMPMISHICHNSFLFKRNFFES